MPSDSFQIRSCISCGLRYPLTDENVFGTRCPVCLGETNLTLRAGREPGADPSARRELARERWATGYPGGGRYRDEPAVTDRNLITAGATNPVEFAREILGRLDVYTPEVLDAWYRLYAHSDASAFEVLQAATAQ